MPELESEEAALDPLTQGYDLRLLAVDRSLRKLVAQNPAAPPDLLTSFASDEDQEVRRATAQNPNTPVDTLLSLAPCFPDAFFLNPILQLLLLENPNLFSDRVTYDLCGHPSAPEFFLLSASSSSYDRVRATIVSNPNCPKSLLIAMVSDSCPEVRRIVSYRLTRPDSLDITALASSKYQEVRNLAAQHPECSLDLLRSLAKDPSDEVARSGGIL